jgi:hypothetical protein
MKFLVGPNRADAGRASGRRHERQRGKREERDDEQRAQRADPVAEEPENRRAGEERGVSDRRDDADPGGRVPLVVGRRAHAEREAERRADAPDRRPGQRQHGLIGEDGGSAAGDGEQHREQENRHPAPPVERHRADGAPERHRGDEDPECDGAGRLGDAVAVDERDREPVVRRALRERHHQHQQPDQ